MKKKAGKRAIKGSGEIMEKQSSKFSKTKNVVTNLIRLAGIAFTLGAFSMLGHWAMCKLLDLLDVLAVG